MSRDDNRKYRNYGTPASNDEVTRAIRRHVWPLLKAVEFTAFTTRSAWRYVGTRVEVVNFQAMGALAERASCTPSSFAVNLGTYLTYVPPPGRSAEPKQIDGRLRPAEYLCHLRATVRPQREQRRPNLSVYLVEPVGPRLEDLFGDVCRQLTDASTWFESLRDDRTVLGLLEEGNVRGGITFSGLPRTYTRAYLAMELGEWKTAVESLMDLLSSDSYPDVQQRLRADLALAERNLAAE